MSTPADPPANPTTPPEGQEPAWYREQMAAKDAELAEKDKELNRQKVKLMEGAFKELGLDPTKGIGKAVATGWNGDADVDAIRQYAIEEWDWEAPADQGQGHALGGDIAGAQGRVSAAVDAAASTPTQQIDLDIAKAEESGDFASAMMLKVQKYREQKGI